MLIRASRHSDLGGLNDPGGPPDASLEASVAEYLTLTLARGVAGRPVLPPCMIDHMAIWQTLKISSEETSGRLSPMAIS